MVLAPPCTNLEGNALGLGDANELRAAFVVEEDVIERTRKVHDEYGADENGAGAVGK